MVKKRSNRARLGKRRSASKALKVPRAKRKQIQPRQKQSKSALKYQAALRFLASGDDFTKAAQKAHLSEKKLRAFAVRKALTTKRGKHLALKKDLKRKVLIFSDERERTITVDTARTASVIGKYMAAVRWFVQTNELHRLEPFVGKSIRDGTGKSHQLETRPNVLHRLASSGGSSFEQVYRIVV